MKDDLAEAAAKMLGATEPKKKNILGLDFSMPDELTDLIEREMLQTQK